MVLGWYEGGLMWIAQGSDIHLRVISFLKNFLRLRRNLMVRRLATQCIHFELARSSLASKMGCMTQQHQNSANPLVAKVRRFAEKYLARHYSLVG